MPVPNGDMSLYPREAVWIGQNLSPGQDPFENGTVLNPCANFTDAKAVADALGLKKFYLRRTAIHLLEADMSEGYLFEGWHSTINLNGKGIQNCVFRNLELLGEGLTIDYSEPGAIFEDCRLSGVTVGPSRFYRCQGHPNLGGYGHYEFYDCFQYGPNQLGAIVNIKAGEESCPTFLKYIGYNYPMFTFRQMRHDTTLYFEGQSCKKVQLEGTIGGLVQVNGPMVLDLRVPAV